MSGVNELTPKQLEYLTHNKAPKQMAIIATYNEGRNEVLIGTARYALSDVDGIAEFAVVVADKWQGKGVATLLLNNLASYAVSAGNRESKRLYSTK